VVLPFANIGGDSEQEYFVDGVTESLTTDLSRMRGMLVIGRNPAFAYKRKHVDLKQIGHELGVADRRAARRGCGITTWRRSRDERVAPAERWFFSQRTLMPAGSIRAARESWTDRRAARALPAPSCRRDA
jgi:hypothetical protein